MPFRRRVSYDGLFANDADDLVGPLGSADGVLAGASTHVGENVPGDLDGAFAATVGAAEDAHAGAAAGGDPSTPGDVIDSGSGGDALRRSVQRYLPAPDAPIDHGFVDPPDPSAIHTGRGFDNDGGGETPPHKGDGPGSGPGAPPVDDPVAIERRARVAVTNLYHELLQRDPDGGGLDYWVSKIVDDGWTVADVRDAFLQSDEYKALHGGG